MREHQLERTEGLTYAQMGRFISADDPESAKGTSDEEAALKDEEGNPISNPARQSWVTAVAITTALNTSYMAEQLSIFGMVVGVALLLTGSRARDPRFRGLRPGAGGSGSEGSDHLAGGDGLIR